MFFLIYGEDNYRARKTLAAVRAKFLAARDSADMNSAVLRAGDDAMEKVAEAVFSSPFLSEKKLVILEDYLGLSESEQKRLEDIIKRKPESTAVVFFEAAGVEDLKSAHLFPLLAGQKYSVECRPLDARSVSRFIKEECAVEGLNIDPKAAQALLALVGLDSWRLHQELAKLRSYAAGSGLKAVTEAMVGELVSGSQEESVFVFLDACTEGRQRQAVLALEKLFLSGVPELQIVAMLMRQFRLMISAHDFARRGGRDPEALAKKLGAHPFPVKKALAAASRFSFDFLAERYRDLVAIDRSIKTGASKPRVLLDIFAARLAAACALPERARA